MVAIGLATLPMTVGYTENGVTPGRTLLHSPAKHDGSGTDYINAYS